MADQMDEEMFSANSSINSESKLEYSCTRLISVEFPGLVQDPSHMVECLGGEEEMTKVFCNPSRRLAMTFRPGDPYSKIQCSDRYPSTSLLLRVRRRKKRGNCTEAGEVNETHEYKQEVLGVVDSTYRFNSLADYQYLSRDVEYPLSCVRGLEMLDEEVTRHLLPPMFSRMEKPTTYQFQPDLQPPHSAKGDMEDEAERYQLIDFRIGSRRVGKNIPIPKRRTFNHPSIPALRKSTTGKPQVDLARGQGQVDKKPDKDDDDLPYVFTANKLPVNKQVFYQLCDLHIGEIQELISDNDAQETECHEKEGWVVLGTLDKIRDILVRHTLTFVENFKKEQETETEKDSGIQPVVDIPWEEHQQVKGFLDMLEGDDDIETYDIFGNDLDEDMVTTELQ